MDVNDPSKDDEKGTPSYFPQQQKASKNRDNYQEKRKSLLQKVKKNRWNWGAALLSEEWLFYHKMYKELGVWYLVYSASLLIAPWVFISKFPAKVQGGFHLMCSSKGSSMLYESLKRKADDGFLYLENYQYKNSILSSIIFYFVPSIFWFVLTIYICFDDFKHGLHRTDMGRPVVIMKVCLIGAALHLILGGTFLILHTKEKRRALRAKQEAENRATQ